MLFRSALTGMAFIGLSIIGELPWWLTIIVLVREWGITLMRFQVLKYGVDVYKRQGANDPGQRRPPGSSERDPPRHSRPG